MAQDTNTEATPIVHEVRQGRALCGFTDEQPSMWPYGHMMAGKPEYTNCPSCVRAQKTVAGHRVLTHLGFGCHRHTIGPMTMVYLDDPFMGEHNHQFPNAEVHPFTIHALLRVLQVDGVGPISTMQFYSSTFLMRAAMNIPAPPDESKLLLNLLTGEVQMSKGVLRDGFVIMRPWVDRWGTDAYEHIDYEQNARVQFEAGGATLAGSMGIWTNVLLDLENGRLLDFFIAVAPPQGVIYRCKDGKVLTKQPA